MHRVRTNMFTYSRVGLQIPGLNRVVQHLDQLEIKEDICRAYDLANPHDRRENGAVWSIAHGRWILKSALRWVSIFPMLWGQTMMTEIFGDEYRHELGSVRNRLLLPWDIEIAMAHGAIVIVPDLDLSSQGASSATSRPQENYKFRVLDPDHPNLNSWFVGFSEPHRLGKDLDHCRLVFPGDLRPRACFLWLWFACAVLKCFWRVSSPQKLLQSAEGMWGISGAYVRKDFVLGLVEEMGQGAAFLLQGAMPRDTNQDDVLNMAVPVLVASHVARIAGYYRHGENENGTQYMGEDVEDYWEDDRWDEDDNMDVDVKNTEDPPQEKFDEDWDKTSEEDSEENSGED
ncbi:hypothetical protein F4808DRAFT_475507 [Astrocystis sublimbata]|nr:hypothetical protein F4808DRAFT_475504 [Astrocystis sublimbata]KAI0204009.1 hypothetical protein F4808DRAFT_475507 [Astrocystis sublimbata]